MHYSLLAIRYSEREHDLLPFQVRLERYQETRRFGFANWAWPASPSIGSWLPSAGWHSSGLYALIVSNYAP
jgi:hypothetical protein